MLETLLGRRFAAWLKWAVLALLSFLAVALALGLSAPPLKPWHTEELEAEFTTGRANEIRTFDDYRRLEQELFQELDERIYADVETGPEHVLARYSRGSVSDPRGRSPDWNRSFELPAEEPAGAVLLLHGLTDSPYTLRSLGQAFNARGYRVLGLRLPGHGTAPAALTKVNWRDMAAAVRLAMGHLAAEMAGKPIHIVGYSMGAALALDFALDSLDGKTAPVPASLVLLSPAVGVHAVAAVAGLMTGLAQIPGLGGHAWLDVEPEFDPHKYNSFATNAAAQVYRLTGSVASRIEERSRSESGTALPSTLVFKSTVDATVSADAVADRLLKHLAPDRHELVLFDINRFAVRSRLLISDPAPLTDRLMADPTLPFTLTLVSNENEKSARVRAWRKPPFSADATASAPLQLAWPAGVMSLSHVALPFPPDDPLYGQQPPADGAGLFLGQMAIQGERGLLRFPADWLLRLRHNPFYDFLERRALAWVDEANGRAAGRAAEGGDN